MMGLDDFVANALKSGLVVPADLARARERLPAEAGARAAETLARLLIEQGSLTPYQARKLLRGATRGFFLGEYRILRSLGEGGMGKVYLASRERDGQEVAIKVLPPKKAADEDALARFRREMELSRRVRHKNIARTLDVGEQGDAHFMVMEYVPGDSLYHLVKSEKRGPLRVSDAARYFLKVLDGLNAAHAEGLIHRDIKPSNLMVTPDGDAKILDLGLARSVVDEGTLTRENVVIGTLDYASPEQLGDAARADRRSDLYSLGCTIYFAVSGRPPFEGGDILNKIYKQRMEEPPPLEKAARGVPSAFAAIVRKLMAKDPAQRHQTGQEVQADLRRWTDPANVRALLGAEAEASRSFRPPPAQLDEDDFRLLDDDDNPGVSAISLQDLGNAEPTSDPVPRSRGGRRPAPSAAPMPPPAVYLGPRRRPSKDSKWLVRFITIAIVLGALAIAILVAIRNI